MDQPESPALSEFLAQYEPPVQQLVRLARRRILDVILGLEEFVDPASKIIAYGASPKYRDLLCAVAPYRAYANLIFSRGVDLPDPHRLLRGAGKRARHVALRAPEDLAHPGIVALLQAAAELAREK
ncbi:MAG TPA: hypothetical protein VIO36_09690 [Anaerolineaceae bacterium]